LSKNKEATMIKRALLPILALMALSVPAMAQDSGGVQLAPGIKGGPVGLARPLPFVRAPFLTAQEAQNGMTAADHQAADQNAITALRGDPGFLSGFSMGTPLAASRQPQVPQNDGGYWRRHHHGQGQGPTIINNTGPLAVTVGNNNLVQQQTANGPGPIAQQQIATSATGSRSGGALNLVTGAGNIIQRAPGGN
jgi:hypothetical protein